MATWGPICFRRSLAFAAWAVVFCAAAENPPAPGAPTQKTTETALFEELPIVEAAALHAQTLEEAAANVTVIRRSDIRRYGWRTLGEVLSNVRGFYVTNDRLYRNAGVRGFNTPGDYNTRFLVMLNGHPMQENIFSGYSYFGQDGVIDLDLVERIEIVRGGTSSLYGSNGMLANINIVTTSPVDSPRFRGSIENGSFGERKALFSTSQYLGRGVNMLFSTSVFNSGGQDLFFPQFDQPENNNGRAVGVDGERGYHSFLNITWRNWNFQAVQGSRQKSAAVGWGSDSIFAARGNNIYDSRNAFGFQYTRELTPTVKLRWSLYYNNYRYRERFDQLVDGERLQNNEPATGDWVNSQVTVQKETQHLGSFTIGGAASFEVRAEQQIFQGAGAARREVMRINQPDRTAALFVQHEAKLGRYLRSVLGLRFDESRNFLGHYSPRAGLIFIPSSGTSIKLLYSLPWRNPSAYEQFFYDNVFYQRTGDLRAESAQSWELVLEKRLRDGWQVVASGYHTSTDGLIQFVYDDSGVSGRYRNTGRYLSRGVELELGRQKTGSWEWQGSLAMVDARPTQQLESFLVNSPRYIGKLRAGIPLANRRWFASATLQQVSSRYTFSGDRLRGVWLTGFNLTRFEATRWTDVSFGVRNAFNYRYEDPVALAIDRIRADGISFYLKLTLRTQEGSGVAP
jgi:outer membrane cobalamin receptor